MSLSLTRYLCRQERARAKVSVDAAPWAVGCERCAVVHWSYEKRVEQARGNEPMGAEVLFDAKSCDFRDRL